MLKLGAGAAVTASAPATLAVSRLPQTRQRASRKPANIIFMVSDGMSPGVPALAEAFSRMIRGDGTGTRWRELARREDVARGYFDMASLNSLVTDSAAAASAWGSGSLIFNWALNMLPDGRELRPLGPLARERGKRVGLVTTTRLTHATPAGFAAVAPNRDLEDEIAPQYRDRVDLLLGGGRRHFDPSVRGDKRDVLDEYRTARWSIVETRDALLNRPAGEESLLGVFWHDHLPYSIDRQREQAIAQRVPTLAEMTRIALANLSRTNQGFLLQVEGGRIDHAAHDNDAAGLLHEQLAFDDAIGEVLEFIRDRDDTLIVITTDHGTGNPGLSGMGSKYHKSNSGFEKLAASTASFETIYARLTAAAKRVGGPRDAQAVGAMIKEATGIELEPGAARLLTDSFAGRKPASPIEVCVFQSNLAALLGQALSNHTGVTFTGTVHTSDWALCLALGPGSERFNGLRACTEAFEIIAEFLDIEHRNPRMTADEAKKFAAATPSTVDRFTT